LRILQVFFTAGWVLLLCGCLKLSGSYHSRAVAGDVKLLEQHPAPRYEERMSHHPVIFIHGLLGAELQTLDDGKRQVWGRFAYADMASQRLFRKLALPLTAAQKYTPIASSGLLNESTVAVGGVEIPLLNYRPVIDFLKKCHYVMEGDPLPENYPHSTLFVYHYDWRKGIDENAAGLSRFIEEKKAYLQKVCQYMKFKKAHEIRFDLIGHSMGGLLARYYVQHGDAALGKNNEPLPVLNWRGAKNVRNVIMVATPNSGYADTFFELVNGLYLTPAAPVFPQGVLGTFVSYYQMFPDPASRSVMFANSDRTVDIFDIQLWLKYQWGILSRSLENRRLLAELLPELSEEQRFNVAADYLRSCLDSGRRFKLLMARPMGLPPEPVRFYLLASAGFPTAEKLAVDAFTGDVSVSGRAAGDGKVTLSSAFYAHNKAASPIFWHGSCTLDGAHMGIMYNELFKYNLMHILFAELQ